MSRLATVAIIGRPNTGKSTLFNRLVHYRQAIVSAVPGTTRDQIAGTVRHAPIPYNILDTGGMGGGTRDREFEKDVHAQSLLALKHADLILFTVSGREDLTRSDREIASILRKGKRTHVPVIVIVTKCDTEKLLENAPLEAYELGVGDETIPVSAEHNLGIEELETLIAKKLQKLDFKGIPPSEAPEVRRSGPEGLQARAGSPKSESPRIAILGQPNVGKSSMINALLSETDRKTSPRLVSDIPGTTRDPTDSVIRHAGKEYIFVDTAGLRKAIRANADDLELLSVLFTEKALERSDIGVLVIDATRKIQRQDKRIARMIVESGKGMIIAINKTDTLKGEERQQKLAEVVQALAFCRHAPFILCSSRTRDGLAKLFALFDIVQGNRARRISDTNLKNFLEEALTRAPLAGLKSCRGIRQEEGYPPSFSLSVRDPKAVRLSELKHLERRMRETFAFEGTPIRITTIAREKQK